MGIINSLRASYGALKILYRLSGVINLFCKRFDRKENSEIRRNAELPSGLLNGQNLMPLAELPYGAWRMGRNGCEAIAVYNALLDLGQPVTLPEVTDQLERKGLLFNGFGGTNLGALAPFFRSRSIPFRILRKRDRAVFDVGFATADCAVLSYWTGKSLRRTDKSWNTLHTVSVHHRGSMIAVCNVTSNGTVPVETASISAFLSEEDAVPVCLFLLSKIG